ncbi:unnamed protein product [Ophioblennius macclurei]
MKSGKKRPLGAAGSRKKVPSDVSPSTSLPPLVEGQLRCFLRVTVGRVLWTVLKPPSPVSVRLRWWGESSAGTRFFPRDGAQPSRKAAGTTARFPVRCGPKQLASYLTDMGSLVLEVLTKADGLPTARAQVGGLARLSWSRPIGGFYALVSPTSDKLGELQVSLTLEPLAEVYNGGGSAPPTDVSPEGLGTPSRRLAAGGGGGGGGGRDSAGSGGGNTPRGKDHLYFHKDLDPPAVNALGQDEDILSVVLERGNKLRNAMVASALKSGPPLRDAPLPLPRDNVQTAARLLTPPPGTFLESLLQADSPAEQPGGGGGDSERRALELLLGSSVSSPPPLLVGGPSPSGSPSECGSVRAESELGEPQYDESLLENLFYKNPVSDCRSEETAEGRRESSPRNQRSRPERTQDSSSPRRSPAPGPALLDEERLASLSSVRRLRVTVHSLALPAAARRTGKPPRPPPARKCAYFVEYRLPETPEATRVASRKESEGVVRFQQAAAFPVRLGSAALRHWWESDLSFRIYCRDGEQKKAAAAAAVGEAVHPLRRLLQSERLHQSLVLPVQSAGRDAGALTVTLELEADGRSFRSEPQREPSPGRAEPQGQLTDSLRHPGLFTSPEPRRREEVEVEEEEEEEEEPRVLLHALLMVPDGKNFSSGSLPAPNVYLNCRLFWCDDTASSAVSWGQTDPTFGLVQVTPVTLTSRLLERMKNNVMVVEAWQKSAPAAQDRLLGLAKLPLHQFYTSYRDPRVAQLLLRAQYPVVAADGSTPVVDVVSGGCRGSLRVVLAMGSSEQILSLRRSREGPRDSPPLLDRAPHLLDQQPQASAGRAAGGATEHLFAVGVERASGLTPPRCTVWGEADCYVQYGFPCQDGGADGEAGEAGVTLKPFRTAATLCVPDPPFDHSETHALALPPDVPVQRLLLASLSGRGLDDGGGGGDGSGGRGVHFEVWCRYYYPNVRDQLVATATLPLSKLCAAVAGHAHSFSLPLTPRTDPASSRRQPSGALHLSVRYQRRPLRREVPRGGGASPDTVTLVVQVIRACGLKAAARLAAERDERLGDLAGEGLNPYVTARLPFLPAAPSSSTRTAPATFCPEFQHRAEVTCDLLLRAGGGGGETRSLAEELHRAAAEFTVWNRDRRKAPPTPADVMLGTAAAPLADLLRKQTGVSGWFGVRPPPDGGDGAFQHHQVLVGGLELSVTFAHGGDRERVVRAARGLGWDADGGEGAPPDDSDGDDDDGGGGVTRKVSLSVAAPRAWIPVHCLLLQGRGEPPGSARCYFRYRLHDGDAFCSRMTRPRAEGGVATASFEGSRTVELRRSPAVARWLREERLEVQVWAAFAEDGARRLVGSAFLDLSRVAERTPTVSGVFPLFRRSAADLQGAALRVHVALGAGLEERREEPAAREEDSPEEEEEEEAGAAEEAPPPRRDAGETLNAAAAAATESEEEESFPATVVVEQAMHLNLKGCPLAERSDSSPRCCVSYATADSAEPASTAAVADTASPVWAHQHQCRLSRQLLLDPLQALVFKVWHKGDTERVIGFAAVDLSPLLSGFPSVCGWYNIADFSGQCRGQLKVSVTPLGAVRSLRRLRRPAGEEADEAAAARDSLAPPLGYRTAATYSSFPAHVGRFPEQKISSPDGIFSRRCSESRRHREHMDQVQLHHQGLQDRTGSSSSALVSALRKNLGELDRIQRYFSRKLSTPPAFPSAAERDEEASERRSDTRQLLLRSSQLVGEVEDIVRGLQGSRPEAPPPTEARSGSAPSAVSAGGNRLQTASRLHAEAESPFCSPPPESPEEEEEEEEVVQEVEEEEEEEEVVQQVEEEEEEEEDRLSCGFQTSEAGSADGSDYEDEEVLEPRTLNEATSPADRSSPWTSVLSDPDPPSPDPSGSGGSDGEEAGSSAGADAQRAPGLGGPQRSAPAELPNFFLSSRQLEASMRAVRLAPVFSRTLGETARASRPRRRPDMSPSSMTRETQRIAKIFASHFDDRRQDGTLSDAM